jgi:hypothetical protein
VLAIGEHTLGIDVAGCQGMQAIVGNTRPDRGVS